jgi:ATP-binding cassette, subfamily B, bacterial PglK
MFNKINIILDSELKKIISIFFISIAAISLLEIFSLSLVIPLITLILNEDLVLQFIYKNLPFLKDYSNSTIVILLFFLLGLTYFLKAILLFLFSWLQFSYVAKLESKLSKSLYAFYLARPYKFFTEVNSSELIRNITEEVNKFTYYIINNSLSLFLEVIIILFISFFLLIYDPKTTTVLLIFCFSISLVIFIITKKKVTKWSEERQYHSKMKIKHIQQGIGGIKEIKVSGNESFFLKYYDEHNKNYNQISKLFNIVTNLPKIILEFFAIIFLIFIITAAYFSGIKSTEILVTLAIFTAAAFRLIPSFNKLNVGYQNFRYGLPSIEVLYNEKLNLIDKKFDCEIRVDNEALIKDSIFQNEIILKDLDFNYGQENILKNINVRIKKNTIIGLVGKSGSGKSTLVDIILGLRKPSKGKILIDNKKDINDLGQNWRNIIGYVPQNLYLLDDTLKKNIALGIDLELIDDSKILKAVKSSQLENFINNNSDQGLETSVGERGIRLSGGQKQRIGIARALYKDPEILIFDEATSALDHDTEKKIIETINTLKNKKTIIIISHRLSALNICDTIYELKDKKINIFKN